MKRNRPGKATTGNPAARKIVRAATAAMVAANRVQRSVPTSGVNSVSLFQPPRPKELKFLDTGSTQDPAVAGTGTLSAGLCLLGQGTTASTRVGTQNSIRSMEWRQYVSLPTTTTGGGAIRTVIVYDKAPNGAAPTIATGAVSDIFNQDNINAQMNLANRDRFVVLQDILVPCAGTAGPQADYQKGYRKMDLPQTWVGASGTVAGLTTGNIVAVTWCSTGFATTAPQVRLQTRFRYEDA